MTEEIIKLKNIAYARSGDKGSSSNIGVIAYTKEGFDFLKNFLTENRVQTFFEPLNLQKTVRYELPNLMAFNFVLHGILVGGGSCSLRIDSQGKALGQAILEMPIEISSEQLKAMSSQKRKSS